MQSKGIKVQKGRKYLFAAYIGMCLDLSTLFAEKKKL